MNRYFVNEMFASLQGEGMRAGTAAVFLRFSKCNLACSKLTGEGFDCDTEFATGEWMTTQDIVLRAQELRQAAGWIIATGGEPALQLDRTLLDSLHGEGWLVAIETNGTLPLPAGIDWVCCSPKLGHPTVIDRANEWKFVMAPGAPLPDPPNTGAWLLSPRFDGDDIDPEALRYCINLVSTQPGWRLSCQQHKWWGVR